MGKNLKFVNEKHEKNYISLINKFVSKINKDIDVVLKLISIDEVYNIAKEYIKGTTIEFKELLNDSRMTNTALLNYLHFKTYDLCTTNFLLIEGCI